MLAGDNQRASGNSASGDNYSFLRDARVVTETSVSRYPRNSFPRFLRAFTTLRARIPTIAITLKRSEARVSIVNVRIADATIRYDVSLVFEAAQENVAAMRNRPVSLSAGRVSRIEISQLRFNPGAIYRDNKFAGYNIRRREPRKNGPRRDRKHGLFKSPGPLPCAHTWNVRNCARVALCRGNIYLKRDDLYRQRQPSSRARALEIGPVPLILISLLLLPFLSLSLFCLWNVPNIHAI